MRCGSLSDPDRWREASRAGLARAAAYDWEASAEQLLDAAAEASRLFAARTRDHAEEGLAQPDDHLAGIGALHQVDEGLRGVFQSVDERLVVADAAVPEPAGHQ